MTRVARGASSAGRRGLGGRRQEGRRVGLVDPGAHRLMHVVQQVAALAAAGFGHAETPGDEVRAAAAAGRAADLALEHHGVQRQSTEVKPCHPL